MEASTRFRSTYQAASTVAEAVEEHFAESMAAMGDKGKKLAPLPHAEAIEVMVDVVFWASLRREEGHSPRISIAFLPPEKSGQPIMFERRLPLNAKVLTKLAPAVERPGIQLGVWHEGDEYYVWGATRDLPGLCFVLEVAEPGMLVIKHRRVDGLGKFFNVAILKGDEVKMIDESKASLPDSPPILTTMLSFASAGPWTGQANVLVQLAISMRAHRRGGILLVVPSGSDTWRDSIIQPITYAVHPPFSKLTQLLEKSRSKPNGSGKSASLRVAIEGVAGLTAVDGATIINDRYELHAFGAKIGRSEKSTRIERMILTEPVVGNTPVIMHPSQNGGTRHLAAAQFVHDQRDSIALVASQDSRFTIFQWSKTEDMVHARRVDTLLL